MKIQMLNTCRLLNYNKNFTFFKGRKYKAIQATNQPNYKEQGLVFVEKKTGESLLIGKEDYKIVN